MNSKTKNKTENNSISAFFAKLNLNNQKIAIIVTAAILVIVSITAAIIGLVDYIQMDRGFDYMKSNLSDYVEFASNFDYKNFKINVDIAKPKPTDVDVAILALRANHKNKEANYGGYTIKEPMEIGAGDIVNIWYRGYLLDDNGEEIFITDLTNFGNKSATAYEIGGRKFIAEDVELNLVGHSTGESPKFEKITVGSVDKIGKENTVVYVNFTRTTNGDKNTKITKSNVRIDLSTDVDDEFGSGFLARISLLEFGGTKVIIDTTKGEDKYQYTDVSISFATQCEVDPLVIEGYFPYDYSTENLRNEKVYFEVYFDGMIDYDAPEFTDEFIQERLKEDDLGVSEEELNKCEGATLVEKYRSYATKIVNDVYEENYESYVKNAVWNQIKNKSNLIKIPGYKAEEIYNEYIIDTTDQYVANGGQVYNSSTGSYQTYKTLDEYATAYYGLSGSSYTWREYVYSLAIRLIQERMVMYYILRAENLVPSDAEFNAEYEKTVNEYVDSYIEEYLAYEDKTKEDFETEEAYEKYCEERRAEIFAYYDDEFFVETTYYNIIMDALIKIETIDIVTLDERRAYPTVK